MSIENRRLSHCGGLLATFSGSRVILQITINWNLPNGRSYPHLSMRGEGPPLPTGILEVFEFRGGSEKMTAQDCFRIEPLCRARPAPIAFDYSSPAPKV